jgi:hypothetical protein
MENIMTVKVTFSDKYHAKRKRISSLPKLMERAVSGLTKKDLIGINKIFHDGIKNNTLRLEKLAEITINSKRKKGFSKPTAPLYGKGDDAEKRSYANMMNITKQGDSWVLKPSTRMHWSGKIKLSDLFKIHEYGAIVRQTRGETEVLIRIPPRPALLLSYRRYLINKRKDKKEQSREVRQAMTDYINNASDKKLKGFGKFVDKVLDNE